MTIGRASGALAEVDVLSVMIGAASLLVIVVLAYLGVRQLNRWMATDEVADIGAGFSLSDLRQLVKTGKMSPEEFEKAKAILVAAAQKPVAKPKPIDRPPG